MSLQKTTIGLTGATGFVGGSVLSEALTRNFNVKCFGRNHVPPIHGIKTFPLELGSEFDLTEQLLGVDCLIHCAARAHVMQDSSDSPRDTYLKFNTQATARLARQASASGVRQFIFLSSVKALGESTEGKPYTHDSPLNPEDDYGLSKALAEQSLKQLADETNMAITIIRPPLVYGVGVRANFASMMRLAAKNWPLPLGSISNNRSLVALDNLVDLIMTCVLEPKSFNKTFLVSDGDDISTSNLLFEMTAAYGHKPRLIPCPQRLLKVVTKIIGREAVAERLLGSLQVDISYTSDELGWYPKYKLANILKEMTRA